MSTMTPEGKIKKKLTNMLKAEKVWYYAPAANGMGRAGIPDVICIVDGRFLGVECKASARAKPTALQLACARDILAAGGAWRLVYDDHTLMDVRGWIHLVRKNRVPTC